MNRDMGKTSKNGEIVLVLSALYCLEGIAQ